MKRQTFVYMSLKKVSETYLSFSQKKCLCPHTHVNLLLLGSVL